MNEKLNGASIREAGLKVLAKAGYNFRREGKGISYNIEGVDQSGKRFRAHVKYATSGGIQATADSNEPNKANFNAVKSDADFVLMIVNDKYGRSGRTDKKSPNLVEVYMVPMLKVEEALRNSWEHRVKSTGGENGPVSLMFRDGQNDSEYGYHRKFADFFIGSADAVPLLDGPGEISRDEIQPLDINQAKAGLSKKFGVPIDAITINISF